MRSMAGSPPLVDPLILPMLPLTHLSASSRSCSRRSTNGMTDWRQKKSALITTILFNLPSLPLHSYIARPHVADHFDLWGADPGLKDTFVATDGQQQYRKFSAAEYRCKTGQTRRKAERDRLHRQANITTIESAIPTTKTSSSSSFIAAIRYILEHLSPLLALYGDVMWAQHRLWDYSGAQKLDHEMVQIFLNGGRKYDPSTAPHPTTQQRTSAHPTRFRQAPSTRKTRIPLIGMGNGSFGMTMRGTKPGLATHFKKVLKHADLQGKLLVVSVDEAYTSKVCSRCQVKEMKNMEIGADSRLHSVLTCKACNTVWNRDVNAANNIFSLAARAIDGLPRPAIFCRPPTTSVAAATTTTITTTTTLTM